MVLGDTLRLIMQRRFRYFFYLLKQVTCKSAYHYHLPNCFFASADYDSAQASLQVPQRSCKRSFARRLRLFRLWKPSNESFDAIYSGFPWSNPRWNILLLAQPRRWNDVPRKNSARVWTFYRSLTGTVRYATIRTYNNRRDCIHSFYFPVSLHSDFVIILFMD